MVRSKAGRIGRKFEAVLHLTTKVLSRAGAFLLILMMIMVAADAFSRYLFNNSIKGVLDCVELTLVFIVFLTMGEVAVRKGHVVVDLVTSQLPETYQTLLNSLMSFGCTVISLLIAWQLGLRGWRQIIAPTQYTENLEIPLGPFILVAAFGTLVLAFVFLIDFFRYWFSWIELKKK